MFSYILLSVELGDCAGFVSLSLNKHICSSSLCLRTGSVCSNYSYYLCECMWIGLVATVHSERATGQQLQAELARLKALVD